MALQSGRRTISRKGPTGCHGGMLQVIRSEIRIRERFYQWRASWLQLSRFSAWSKGCSHTFLPRSGGQSYIISALSIGLAFGSQAELTAVPLKKPTCIEVWLTRPLGEGTQLPSILRKCTSQRFRLSRRPNVITRSPLQTDGKGRMVSDELSHNVSILRPSSHFRLLFVPFVALLIRLQHLPTKPRATKDRRKPSVFHHRMVDYTYVIT